MKKFIIIALAFLCTLTSCKNKLEPEYSVRFRLEEKTTLSGFFVYNLRTENLAFVANRSGKNKIVVFSDSEKFFTKEKITGTYVMIDVFSYMEIYKNEVRTIPLLIKNDGDFEKNREVWFQIKNENPYCQHLYY